VSVDQLSKENGEDLTVEDLVDGNNVLYEDSTGKTFDVTIKGVQTKENLSLKRKHLEALADDTDTQSLLQDLSQIRRDDTKPKSCKVPVYGR
jgi:hypothetical protein